MANNKETSIGIRLVADLRNYQSGLQKAGKENSRYRKNVNTNFGGIGKLFKTAAVAAGGLFAAGKVIDAAKAVFNYAAEISNVKNKIESLTGLQGAALDQMTGGVQALAKAYDADINKTVEASNVVMQAFGKNADDTFKLFNAGLSGAANANGEFIEQVREYAPHFAEAGATAEEMYTVIEAGNKQGIFNDKAADSIKEGSIRLREMTKATREAIDGIGLSSTEIQEQISNGSLTMFQAMQMVSAKLNELPEQSPAVGAALADIFGGPGEDAVNFIRSLSDVNGNLAAITEGTTAAQRAQIKYAEELKEFHTVGAEVFGGTATLMTNLKTVGMKLFNGMIKGTVSIINYFIDLYNESMVFRASIEYLKIVFKTTFGFIGAIVKQFWNQLKGMGQLLKAVFTGNFSEIPNIIKNTFKQSIDNAKDFGAKTAENFKNGIKQTITPRDKIDFISLSADEAIEAGKTVGKNLATGIKQGISTVRQSVGMAPIENKQINSIETRTPDTSQLNSMENWSDRQVDKLNQLNQKWYETQEVADAVAGSVSGAFETLGMNIVESMGMAETGFGRFLGTLLQGTIRLISMMLGQSIATSIAGATQSGAATGPAAVITTPAFIAQAVATVLGAFAAIPKLASGGAAYGDSLVRVGEYAGARVNPEVIAPLDKLQGMLNNGNTNVNVTLGAAAEIDLRKLYIRLQQVGQNINKVR